MRAWSRTILCFLIVAVFCAATAELSARYIFRLSDREATRTFQPYFVSGHYFEFLKSLDALENNPWEGPAEYSYAFRRGIFIYQPDRLINSVAERFDWVFKNEFSRYTVEEMDRISQTESQNICIYVIGGSTALGTHASSREAVWYARLEKRLRAHFDRSDIYVFNAAVGGFVSTQERLVLELAVGPRRPDLVIVLNGVNDVFLPIMNGSRPGDPYHTGMRYAQYYDASLLRSLSLHSDIVRSLHRDQVKRAIIEYRKNILSDQKRLEILAENVINVYCDNMDRLLKRLHQENSEGLIFLQPWQDLSRHEAGESPVDKQLFGFLYNTYHRLSNRFRLSHGEFFIDLSHILSDRSRLSCYTDSCHLNDEGQKILSDAMFTSVSEAVKRIYDK